MSMKCIASFFALIVLFAPQLRAEPSQTEIDKLRGHVETNYRIVEALANKASSGLIPEVQAKEEARRQLAAYRYDRVEHLWVIDTEMRMVMHPHISMLVGKDLSGAKDSRGKRFVADAVRVARADGDGGFTSHLGPRPGATEATEKLTYVKLFAPWGWIVCTTINVQPSRPGPRIRPAEVLAHFFKILPAEYGSIRSAVRMTERPPLLQLNTRHVDYERFVTQFASRAADAIMAGGHATPGEIGARVTKLHDFIARRTALAILDDVSQLYFDHVGNHRPVDSCNATNQRRYPLSEKYGGEYRLCFDQTADDQIKLSMSVSSGRTWTWIFNSINQVFVLQDIVAPLDAEAAEFLWAASR
jgi:hypothetical protein